MALQGSMNLPARGFGQVGPLSQHVSEVVRMGRAISVGRHQLPAFSVHCSATFTTSNVKLPATHLSSSSLALQQLALSSGVNRYAMEKKSSIIGIGLTIANTPVELREKMAVPEAEWPRAIEELCTYPHIEEAAVLSTCNRMELYVVALSWHRGVAEVKEWMHRQSGVPMEDLEAHVFLLRDRDATQHLMEVAGGLDSLIKGEGQILAQVKQVYGVGQNSEGFGRHLNGLFKQAITAGKRVRAETKIASGAVSVSSAAAELAALKLPTQQLQDAKVCVIGAGKMSRLLFKHMAAKGCTRAVLLNRSLPRAQAMAEEFPQISFDIRLMDQLLPSVAECDTIFAASSSEHVLLSKADVEPMPPASAAVGGVRRFFDIAVPRNISSDVNDCGASAHVYNVDDLKEVVDQNKEAREEACREAEVILAQEQAAFEAWRDSLETVPTIKALRTKAEDIRQSEFEKVVGKLAGKLSKKELCAVELMSKGIVNKLLHGCMTSLRCDGGDAGQVSETLANMEALERMFELRTHLEMAQAKAEAKAGQR